jgi:hypothetical protein
VINAFKASKIDDIDQCLSVFEALCLVNAIHCNNSRASAYIAILITAILQFNGEYLVQPHPDIPCEHPPGSLVSRGGPWGDCLGHWG